MAESLAEGSLTAIHEGVENPGILGTPDLDDGEMFGLHPHDVDRLSISRAGKMTTLLCTDGVVEMIEDRIVKLKID